MLTCLNGRDNGIVENMVWLVTPSDIEVCREHSVSTVVCWSTIEWWFARLRRRGPRAR